MSDVHHAASEHVSGEGAACYGLIAEFRDPESLAAATRLIRAAGYDSIDTFTPFPLEELTEAMNLPRTRIALYTLVGGIVGGVSALAMMIYATVWSYPVNVGGRPLFSWPAYIPITFELTVLGASLSAVFGMLLGNRLPQLHHPLFNLPQFEAASRDGFFLCIQAEDPQFDLVATQRDLENCPGSKVYKVPA